MKQEKLTVRSMSSDEFMQKSGATINISVILAQIEERLLDAAQRRFTGEIRLTFNMSQGGFCNGYIEKERESLIRKR